MIYLLDPLIATGGTAVAAMNMILDWGVPGAWSSARTISRVSFRATVTRIKLLCVLASQDGLKHVQTEFPELEVRIVPLSASECDPEAALVDLGRRR